jgi:hypothetical protein
MFVYTLHTQLWHAQKVLREQEGENGAEDATIRNVVFMGMGEPLANYPEVSLSLRCDTERERERERERQVSLSLRCNIQREREREREKHTQTHTCVYIYICIYICTYTICVYVCVCARACTYIQPGARACAQTYSLAMFKYTPEYVYIHINI